MEWPVAMGRQDLNEWPWQRGKEERDYEIGDEGGNVGVCGASVALTSAHANSRLHCDPLLRCRLVCR